MMREWKDPQGTAARCLACLSSRVAAAPPDGRPGPGSRSPTRPPSRAFVVGLVNDRGDKPAWKVPASTVDDLAELLVHGDPLLRARSALLLRHLDAEEQAAFDQAWSVHAAGTPGRSRRSAGRRRRRKPVPLQYGPEQLRELAFGAYVGLVREQGGAKRKGQASAGPEATRVPQAALARILALAKEDPHHAGAARPVFLQALGDPEPGRPVPGVRALAGPRHGRRRRLAAEALATGHTDLGVKGLELLTGGASDDGGAGRPRTGDARAQGRPGHRGRQAPDRPPGRRRRGRPCPGSGPRAPAAPGGLLAGRRDTTRTRPPATRLRLALKSRYQAVREAAALELATKKDPAAFEALVGLLEAAGDPKPAAPGDRGPGDAGRPARRGRLPRPGRGRPGRHGPRRRAARGRRPVPPPRGRRPAAGAHGQGPQAPRRRGRRPAHDQRLRPADRRSRGRAARIARWEEKQFPRHDAVLARLMDRLSAPADARHLLRLLPGRAMGAGEGGRSRPGRAGQPPRRLGPPAGRSRRWAGGSGSARATRSRSGRRSSTRTRSPSSSPPRAWPRPAAPTA